MATFELFSENGHWQGVAALLDSALDKKAMERSFRTADCFMRCYQVRHAYLHGAVRLTAVVPEHVARRQSLQTFN